MLGINIIYVQVVLPIDPTLMDTSLPLNQSYRLAQERGAVWRSEVFVGDRRRSVPFGFMNSFLLYVVGCKHT